MSDASQVLDNGGGGEGGGGGGDAPLWTEGMDEATVEHMATKGYDGPVKLASAYMSLEKAVGADKVVLPSAEGDILEWEGWEKLGTPKEAEDYAMAAPEGFENYDQGLSDNMRGIFHKARLTPAQATLIHDGFVEHMGTTNAESAAEVQQRIDGWNQEMHTKYGTAYDERIEAANSILREYAAPEVLDMILGNNLGSFPPLVDMLAKMRMALGKGSQFHDGEGSGKFGYTPEQAKAEIAKIRANPAYTDKSHPENKVLSARMTKMHELAFGTEVKSVSNHHGPNQAQTI